MTFYPKVWTGTVTSTGALVISGEDGYTQLAVKVSDTSTGSCTITSTGTLRSANYTGAGAGIVLSAGNSWELSVIPYALDSITITCASGCTAYVSLAQGGN
jgi:hypothetical protein